MSSADRAFVVRFIETAAGALRARITDVRSSDRWSVVDGERARALSELLITDPTEPRSAQPPGARGAAPPTIPGS